MALEVFSVSLDDNTYRSREHTAYTDGDFSAQLLSVYLPHGSPGDYPINKGRTKFAYMLWPQKDGAANSPYWFVGGTTSNAAADDMDPARCIDTIASDDGLFGVGLAWQCLMNGIAIIPVRVTVAKTTNTNGTVPTGNGFLHAPGGVLGYYESLNRPNARKDVRMAWQYVQLQARNYPTVSTASTVWSKLDADRCGIMGNSAGGDAAAWLACAPDRAYEGGTFGQHIFSTVPNVFVATNFLATWWRYADFETGAPNFPRSEAGGAGSDDTACTDLVVGTNPAPDRYVREFSIANYMSDIGQPCIPPTWVWSDVASISNNPGLPHVEDAQAEGHEFITLLKLKFLASRGRVFAATGSSGVVCNTTEDFAPFCDRIDMSGADPTASNGAALDMDGVAGHALTPAGGGYKAIDHILAHINTPRWDLSLPPAGIGRRGQVNSTGSFRVPPRENRGGVRIFCTSRGAAGEVPLLVGSDSDNVIAEVLPGKPLDLAFNGALWFKAAGGAAQVARFSAREVAVL